MKTRDLLFHTATGSTPPTSHDDEQPDRTADEEDASRLQVPPRKTPAVQVRPELSVTEMEDEVEDLLQPYSICLDVPSGNTQNSDKAGKWLRHYRTQSAKYRTAAGPQKVYRLLPYQTLDQEPYLPRENAYKCDSH
jgi:hypothetical protein